MTNKQSEALRLAELILERPHDALDFLPTKAAAELRRLHEVNQELLEALEAIDALNIVAFEGRWHALALECQEMAFKAVYKARRTK